MPAGEAVPVQYYSAVFVDVSGHPRTARAIRREFSIAIGGTIQPGGVVDAYTLTNLRVTYEMPNRDWSLSYALTNATDDFYLLNIFDLRAFDIGTVKSQPGRPREWSLTFRHNFGG